MPDLKIGPGLSRADAIDLILAGGASWADLGPYCGDVDLHNLKCYAVATWLDSAHRAQRGLGPSRDPGAAVSDQIFLVLGGREKVKADPALIDRALDISKHIMAWALDHLRGQQPDLLPYLPEPLDRRA